MEFKINKEEYFKQYKKIYKKTLQKGILIPAIFPSVIPDEYDYTLEERRKIHKQISKETLKKLEELYIERRKIEIEQFKKGNTENVKEYLLKEIKKFNKTFPEYKELITIIK